MVLRDGWLHLEQLTSFRDFSLFQTQLEAWRLLVAHVFRGSIDVPARVPPSVTVLFRRRADTRCSCESRVSAVTNVVKSSITKCPHETSFAHHFYSKDTFISYRHLSWKKKHILLRFINKHRNTSWSRHKTRTTATQSSGAFGTWLTPACETHPFGNFHIQHSIDKPSFY